jgi:ribosomal protein L10
MEQNLLIPDYENVSVRNQHRSLREHLRGRVAEPSLLTVATKNAVLELLHIMRWIAG